MIFLMETLNLVKITLNVIFRIKAHREWAAQLGRQSHGRHCRARTVQQNECQKYRYGSCSKYDSDVGSVDSSHARCSSNELAKNADHENNTRTRRGSKRLSLFADVFPFVR